MRAPYSGDQRYGKTPESGFAIHFVADSEIEQHRELPEHRVGIGDREVVDHRGRADRHLGAGDEPTVGSATWYVRYGGMNP